MVNYVFVARKVIHISFTKESGRNKKNLKKKKKKKNIFKELAGSHLEGL